MFDRQTIFQLLVRAIILFTVIPVHECAHGIVADKMGDHTARNLGRNTLNPFVHLDPVGSVLLLFTGFGWAKPVPIITRNFENVKKGMAITALAGPVANILLALVLLVVYKIALPFIPFNGALNLIFYIVITNTVALGVFNMIPIPPLDGSRLLTALLPYKAYYAVMRYERVIMAVLFVALFSGFLSLPIQGATQFICQLLDNLTGFLGHVF